LLLAEALEAVRAADHDPATGLPLAERVALRASRAGHREAASMAHRAWGHALLHVGDLDAAIRHLNSAVRWGRRAGSPELAAEARLKLAFALVQRGRPRPALREIETALQDLKGTSAARAHAQRAIIFHIVGRLDESLAEFEVALRVLRRHQDRLGVQRMLINRALVLSDRHAFAAAERDLLEAEELAGQLGRRLTIGLVANNLGLMETLRGDVPAALRHLDRAESIIAEHGAQLGTLYQDRAELLLSVGLVSEARSAAEQALLAYRREGRSLKVPEVQLLLAQAAVLDGDRDAARAEAGHALRRFRAQGRPEWAELARLAGLRTQTDGLRVSRPTLDAMVATLDTAGWPAAALDAALVAAQLSSGPGPAARRRAQEYLQQAAAHTRGRGPAVMRARGWYARALLAKNSGDPQAVLSAARTGLRLLAEYAAAMGATDLRVHAAGHRTDLADLGLRTAFGTGRARTVLEWAERARASHLLARPVRPPADPELSSLLADLRAVARDLTGHTGGALLTRQAQLERRIRDRSRHLNAGPGQTTEPVSAPVLAAALGSWALIEYIRMDGDLHALTLVDGRLRVRRLGAFAEVSDLADRITFALRRLVAPLSSTAAQNAARALLNTATARLDQLLLAPLEGLGERPLVVVPTGVLHSLPWSLLPSCRGRPITVAPSATLWQAAAGRHARSGPVHVVAGPRLAAAGPEAEAIARLYGTEALTGADATVAAVLDQLSEASLIHLAAHSWLSAESPLFSSITLADGPC
jgi:tetratricopeptide (TPR) repeat protein